MYAPYNLSNGIFSFFTNLVFGFSSFSSLALTLVCYVLWALGIYTIAKRRGIRNPWLAWVPVVRIWLLGSISDQYQYVVRGRVTSRRKTLLALSLVKFVLNCVVLVTAIGTILGGIGGAIYGVDVFFTYLIRTFMSVGGIGIVLMIVSAAWAVIRLMALYDLYVSCCPQEGVLFLLLSIFFPVSSAFFIFFFRNRDDGMPPRRENPGYHRTVEEPWDHQ